MSYINSREMNMEVFRDTLKFIAENSSLSDSVKKL